MRAFKIILTLTYIFFFVSLIFGNSDYALACGIFAWVGKDTKFFRRDFFNILGMYNDSRGGDSCGIYYDNYWIKGIGNTAKYEKLIPEFDLHNSIKLKEHPVIIGHTRKSSVGATSIDNAQPVIIESEEGDTLYVQAHNGTITNYSSIAKKHGISLVLKESDSIAMARLIEEVGFDVLGEYEGSGAFVMYFRNEPDVLYAFHGKSKATEYAAVAVEERPLAYLNIPGKGTYISSDITHLSNLGNPKKDISPVEFAFNTLYRLEGDQVTVVREIDRLAIKPVTTSRVVHSSTSYDLVKKSLLYYHGTLLANTIRFNRGFYYTADFKPAHGVYILDAWGYISKGIKIGTNTLFEVCFVYGIMMRDRESYERMMSYVEEKKLNTFDIFHKKDTFTNSDLINKLKKYAAHPFTRYTDDNTSAGALRPNCMPEPRYPTSSSYYYDGLYRPLFSRFEFRLWNGDITYSITDKSVYSINEYLKDNSNEDWFRKTSPEELTVIMGKIKEDNKKRLVMHQDDSCGTCHLYSTNPDYCDIYCNGYNQPSTKALVTAEKQTEEDDKRAEADRQYVLAYKEYEDSSGNSQLAKEVLFSEFKELYKSIENCIDTYDGVANDLGKECEEEVEIIDELRTISLKINKY